MNRDKLREVMHKALIPINRATLMEILLAEQRKKQIVNGDAGYTIYGNRIVIYKNNR